MPNSYVERAVVISGGRRARNVRRPSSIRSGLRPGSALDDRSTVVTTDPAPETRVGTSKGSHARFERGAIRNRAFARSTAETDSATAAQIMKCDRVTACAMEGLSQTDTLGDSELEVSDQQLEVLRR